VEEILQHISTTMHSNWAGLPEVKIDVLRTLENAQILLKLPIYLWMNFFHRMFVIHRWKSLF